MGHVVNPITFRLGSVKIWNSNIFLDNNNLKFQGYFAAFSLNLFYILSKVFRSRFFTYVTSYIFTNVKINFSYNKILCLVFLYNGSFDHNGLKISSAVNFFFEKPKKRYQKFLLNLRKMDKSINLSYFPSKFLFEFSFSYNFFFRMWINKLINYESEYNFIKNKIKIDSVKECLKRNLLVKSSTFKRFLFKHSSYLKKELKKKWKQKGYNIIKRRKKFRNFFLYFFMKRSFFTSIQKVWLKQNKDFLIVGRKLHKNLLNFRKFIVFYIKSKLKLYIKYRIQYYLEYKKKGIRRNYKKMEFAEGFISRNFVLHSTSTVIGWRKKKIVTKIMQAFIFFKFFLNKLMKRLKYSIYRVFFKNLIKLIFFTNKFMKILKKISFIKFLNIYLYFLLFSNKIKMIFLFKYCFIKINVNKIKNDLIFTRILSSSFELLFFKSLKWNFEGKFVKFLENIFHKFRFKMEFHFIQLKNLNSKIISLYIIIRLKQYYQIGQIVRQLKEFFKYSTKRIRGWKITCAGRFSRKEIASFLTYKGGSFGYSSVISLLDYAFNEIILKYSICGIKVWLVLRKHFKYEKMFKFIYCKIIKKKIYKQKNTKKIYKYLHLSFKHLTKSRKNICYKIFKNYYLSKIFLNNNIINNFWQTWYFYNKFYKFIF